MAEIVVYYSLEGSTEIVAKEIAAALNCDLLRIETIKKYAFKVNEILKSMFLNANLKLIDFKIEFGRFHGDIILADEISPDTCRLWDVNTNEKLDKDRFRRDLGNVEEAYQEVFRRIFRKK